MANMILGIFLLTLATISIIIAFLLAVRPYLAQKAQKALPTPPTSTIDLFLKLLDDILKAPPALAFLVAGILIGAAGIWILTVKPV